MPVFTAQNLVREIQRHDKKAAQGAIRALNRTATTARKIAVSEVRQTLNVKSGAAKKLITITRASKSRPVAIVRSKYERVPLTAFSGVRKVRGGMSVEMQKGRGRKLFKGAFRATMKSGHKGIYRRRGRSRLPINELVGPSVQGIMDRVVIKRVIEQTNPILLRNIEREVAFALSK